MLSKKNRSKLRKKFLFKKYKYVSPLIATILLVVVSVIIISVLLNWGSAFTRKSLDDVSKTSDLKRDDTLFSSFQTYQQRSDGFVFKNLSNKKVEFTHYKIISEDAFKFSDILLPFDSTLQVSSGGQVSIPILCSPSSSYHVNLVTSEGTYVTVPINNIDSELNSCNSPEIPDLVCLGINDNGSGTSEEDPIVICSVDDLNNVRNGLDKHYKLGINLDLNVSPYNEGEGWLPIGNSSTKFSGSLNGSIYTISNLYINRPTTDYQGLFGYINTGSVFNKLKLKNVNVTGAYNVGGLVGYSNRGSIYNSYSTGSVLGNGSLGGLVGFLYSGSIFTSYSAGSVLGNGSVGGLVGTTDLFSNISNCYSTCSVLGATVGGLVGYNFWNTLYNCYSAGFVSGTSTSSVGGLVGSSSSSTISNSYWDVQTSNQSTSGGEGKTSEQMKQITTFISGWDFDDVWVIDEGISYPYLKNNEQIPHPKPKILIFSNFDAGDYQSLFLDISLFSNPSFGDIYYTINGSNPSCFGNGILYNEPIVITTGETEIKAIGCETGYESIIFSYNYNLVEPTIIMTPDDLNNVRNDLSKLYVLGSNIDLNIFPYNTGEGWVPIGNNNNKFFGGFDGNGYVISNLFINGPTTAYQGLFGYTDVSVIINNIKLENVNVTGSAFVGGLVGFNEGMILNSYSSGSVSGNRVGGLIGVDTGGFISNCYSNGFVFGIGAYIGGLVGYLDKGSIYNSYSTSSVFGGQAWGIGGLVGGLYGSVSVFNSYSTGLVSGTSSAVGGLVGDDCSSSTAILYNSYWDIQTSERSSSEGGTGKTTSEMQQQSTFSLEWDFDTVWQIQEGVTYPYLISNPQSPPPQ